MRSYLMNFVRKSPVITGIALGLMLIIIFVVSQQSPVRNDEEEKAIEVTVFKSGLLPFRVEARGYGVVQPSETWQAFASVAGKVVRKHHNLESGATISEGELLLALDPSRYELAVAEAKSSINNLEEELLKLNVEQKHTERLYELEKERLKLSENELNRMQELFRSGAVAQSKFEEQQRVTISQRQTVEKLDNTLVLFKNNRNQVLSQLERGYIHLAQAEEDLKDTRFIAPYDLQIGDVAIELHQFVKTGQLLFKADDLEAVEIEARIPYSVMQRLIANLTTRREPVSTSSENLDLSKVIAEITHAETDEAYWKGNVIRVANGLDALTRTARVTVRVDNPQHGAHSHAHQELIKNMYTKVVLSVPSIVPLMAIPVSSVHQGEIWLVNDDNRLMRRKVKVEFEQNGLAVIASGLEPGELIITDDLPLAINGMLLDPYHDEKLQHKIEVMALGEQQ
ncbi:efflux RND transporter periplasmic adaptor subunit [Kangiella sp.]|uniref:efflux RND transporter periplasmic adaptor subunit n=1 Tax=Kangiella sp. TaxID=1920245 RepID=UPI003A8C8F96